MSQRKLRADQLLVEQKLAPNRSKAQALILAGRVYLDERKIEKAGTQLPRETKLSVRAGPRFVSRGGDKLSGALDDLNVKPQGLICVDVGASTGGFTDCLLQRGAARVYAVDVGRGLLADPLRADPRVVVMERTNARTLTAEMFQEPPGLACVDASFISITKLLPALASSLKAGARLLAMVKPQFEVGRKEAQRSRGVIRDESVRAKAIESVIATLPGHRFEFQRSVDSRVSGPKGNVEHFILARRC